MSATSRQVGKIDFLKEVQTGELSWLKLGEGQRGGSTSLLKFDKVKQTDKQFAYY